MNRTIDLVKIDGKSVKCDLKILDITYLDKIMEFQELIINGLEDKQLYAKTNREEFEEYISKIGTVIGCVTIDEDEIIAIGVLVNHGYGEHNYGYDIDLQGEELLSVGQIESTLVKHEFRGNRLQKIICKLLERIGKEKGMKIMCATASPYNNYSVNNFIDLRYKIVKEKLKYGGLRRYIFKKEL